MFQDKGKLQCDWKNFSKSNIWHCSKGSHERRRSSHQTSPCCSLSWSSCCLTRSASQSTFISSLELFSPHLNDAHCYLLNPHLPQVACMLNNLHDESCSHLHHLSVQCPEHTAQPDALHLPPVPTETTLPPDPAFRPTVSLGTGLPWAEFPLEGIGWRLPCYSRDLPDPSLLTTQPISSFLHQSYTPDVAILFQSFQWLLICKRRPTASSEYVFHLCVYSFIYPFIYSTVTHSTSAKKPRHRLYWMCNRESCTSSRCLWAPALTPPPGPISILSPIPLAPPSQAPQFLSSLRLLCSCRCKSSHILGAVKMNFSFF